PRPQVQTWMIAVAEDGRAEPFAAERAQRTTQVGDRLVDGLLAYSTVRAYHRFELARDRRRQQLAIESSQVPPIIEEEGGMDLVPDAAPRLVEGLEDLHAQ